MCKQTVVISTFTRVTSFRVNTGLFTATIAFQTLIEIETELLGFLCMSEASQTFTPETTISIDTGMSTTKVQVTAFIYI